MAKYEYKKGQPIRNMWRGMGNAYAWMFGKAEDAFNAYTGVTAQREANEMNYQIMKEQNAFNAAEAQKTRDWNSIGEQMARARAAGLNPVAEAMANNGMNMSAGDSAQASASMPPTMLPETNQAASLMEAAGSFALNGMQAITEANARKAKIELINSQIAENLENAKNLGFSSATLQKGLEWYDVEKMSEVQQRRAETKVKLSDKAKIDRELKEMVDSWDERLTSIIMDNNLKWHQSAEIEQLIQKYASEIDLNEASVDNLRHQNENLDARTQESRSQTELNQSQTEQTKEETIGIHADNAEKLARAKIAEELTNLYYDSMQAAYDLTKANTTLSNKEARWYAASQISEIFKNVGVGIGGVAAGVGQVVKMATPVGKIGF